MSTNSKEYQREYYRKNKERIIAQRKAAGTYGGLAAKEAARRYRETHRDELNAARRERYANDEEYREKKKAQNLAYQHAHADECRAKVLEYQRTHREKANERSRKHYHDNIERERTRRREYARRKAAERKEAEA